MNISKNFKVRKKKSLQSNPKFRSIKTTVNHVLLDKDRDLPLLNHYVLQINKMITFTFLLVRAFLIKQYKDKQPLLDIQESTFEVAMQCICQPDDISHDSKSEDDNKRKEKALIVNFFKTSFLPLINDRKSLPDWNYKTDRIINGQHIIKNKKLPFSPFIQKLRTNMLTVFINNIWMHYFKRLKRTIYTIVEKNPIFIADKRINKEKKKIKYGIFNAVLSRNRQSEYPEYQDLINESIQSFIPKEQHSAEWVNDSLQYDLKANSRKFFIPSIAMQEKLESLEVSGFQSIPLRKSFVPHYIQIDSVVLKKILKIPGKKLTAMKIKTSKIIEESNNNPIDGDSINSSPEAKYTIDPKDELWSLFLNLDLPIFKQNGYSFFHSIEIDGFGCVLKFQRNEQQYNKYDKNKKSKKTGGKKGKKSKGTKKKINDHSKLADEINNEDINEKDNNENNEEELENKLLDDDYDYEDNLNMYINNLSPEQREELKDCILVGVDPGKYNIIQMVGSNGKVLRYRIPQRRTESGTHDNYMVRKKIYDSKPEVIELLNKLSKTSSITVDYDKFCDYIKVRSEITPKLTEMYDLIVFRKLKFRGQIRAQASYDKLIDRIQRTFGANCVLLYGNWSRTSQMKGIVPTPGIGLRNLLSTKFRLFIIDEYKTSKKCCHCHKDLEMVYKEIQAGKNHKKNQKKKKNKNKKVQKSGKKRIYRVLVCRKCPNLNGYEGIRYIQRDINGGKNILDRGREEIYGLPRALAFQRTRNVEIPIGTLAKIKIKIIRKEPGSTSLDLSLSEKTG